MWDGHSSQVQGSPTAFTATSACLIQKRITILIWNALLLIKPLPSPLCYLLQPPAQHPQAKQYNMVWAKHPILRVLLSVHAFVLASCHKRMKVCLFCSVIASSWHSRPGHNQPLTLMQPSSAKLIWAKTVRDGISCPLQDSPAAFSAAPACTIFKGNTKNIRNFSSCVDTRHHPYAPCCIPCIHKANKSLWWPRCLLGTSNEECGL